MKIEKGVPIPVTNPKKHTKYGYLRKMDYGDSVVTDSNTKKQIISAVIRGHDPYCKVVTRTLRNEKGEREIRIWKVKLTKEKLCRYCGQVIRPEKENGD